MLHLTGNNAPLWINVGSGQQAHAASVLLIQLSFCFEYFSRQTAYSLIRYLEQQHDSSTWYHEFQHKIVTHA